MAPEPALGLCARIAQTTRIPFSDHIVKTHVATTLINSAFAAQFATYGEWFIDAKLCQPPDTNRLFARLFKVAGASYITVLASHKDFLPGLRAVVEEISGTVNVLALLSLTSESQSARTIVARAKRAEEYGAEHFVCPPTALRVMRAQFPSALLFVPAVRDTDETCHNHTNVVSLERVVREGGIPIIGRPITQDVDPVKKAVLLYGRVQAITYSTTL